MGRFPFRTSKLWNNSEDQAMTTLADIAARRGFRRLVHIHCDHFEPEVAIQKGVYHPDKLAAYLRNMYPFRPSLFFMPSFCVMLRDDADSEIVAQRSDDPVVFTDFSRGSQVSESLKVAKADGRCDIHGHMHHELWTKNECTGAKLVPRPQTHLDAKQHRLRDWVQNDSTAAADSARFSLALELYLDWFATHIGDMTDWCFVHGCWALQASDPTICTITDEIKRLHDQGCRGDFSFPAGRRKCDPARLHPYTILPTVGVRAYDFRRAEPRSVHEYRIAARRFLIWNSGRKHWWPSLDYKARHVEAYDFRRAEPRSVHEYRIAARRFLIWNSGRKHWWPSLDYKARHVEQAMTLPRVMQFLEHDAPVVGDSLILKTHAHSMDCEYLHETGWRSPLAWFRPVMAEIEKQAISAGVDVEYMSVREFIREHSTAP